VFTAFPAYRMTGIVESFSKLNLIAKEGNAHAQKLKD